MTPPTLEKCAILRQYHSCRTLAARTSSSAIIFRLNEKSASYQPDPQSYPQRCLFFVKIRGYFVRICEGFGSHFCENNQKRYSTTSGLAQQSTI